MRPVLRADNLTNFLCPLSWNLRVSTSWKPQGLSRPAMGLLYLLRFFKKSFLTFSFETTKIFSKIITGRITIYRVIKNDCQRFNSFSYTITLEKGVYSCIDGSRNSQSFLLWCAMCISYAFLRLERSLLRWRRTAWEGVLCAYYECRSVIIVQRQFRTYRAPVRYVTKTWSVVILNKRIHILLS